MNSDEQKMLLIGFPQNGRVLTFDDWNRRDEAGATAYYAEILMGKRREEIRRIVDHEVRLEAEGAHDASNIYYSDVEDDPAKAVISYRFGLKDPKQDTVMAAMMWEVYLTFNEQGVVSKVVAEASILAP
ncbi:hypothetical protein GOZ90_27050 [Agrobacterium vitis]|uniref:Uncharacterized protein n=1 Tax=Agrobacterium vitis TaxID=373 RepID=A0A6L6VNQ5_AGRVI|nr:hypothetical protein [Agrobacterium vitis]MUZ76275.1 hypothetical protein [Agrobacterium vitis]MVA27864.1 hypothetical protein [Agrobacterium vitis]